MNHTKSNCSSCNKELHIKIAKGENAPNSVMCKACSQTTKQPVRMKLADALKVAKGSKRVMRGTHREHNFVVTHKQDLTPREEAHRNRIYGNNR